MNVTPRARKTKKGFSIYLDVYHKGVRRYKTLYKEVSFKDKRSYLNRAEVTANEMMQYELLRYDDNNILTHKSEESFTSFLDYYMGQYHRQDYRVIKAVIVKFKNFINSPDIKFSEIDSQLLDDFRYYLRNSAGLRGESVQSYCQRFKKILKYACDKKYLHKQLYTDFKSIRNHEITKKEVLRHEEIMSLYNYTSPNEEVKKAFLFACYSGLGLAEIKRLRWKNIVDNKFHISRSKTGTIISLELSELAVKIIGQRKSDDEFVFDLINKNTLQNFSGTTINNMLNRWLKTLKINKKLTFYCARHTFANLFLNVDTNNEYNTESKIFLLSKALGHRRLETTKRYIYNYYQNVHALTRQLDNQKPS